MTSKVALIDEPDMMGGFADGELAVGLAALLLNFAMIGLITLTRQFGQRFRQSGREPSMAALTGFIARGSSSRNEFLRFHYALKTAPTKQT
jgi:hypothetical protein